MEQGKRKREQRFSREWKTTKGNAKKYICSTCNVWQMKQLEIDTKNKQRILIHGVF